MDLTQLIRHPEQMDKETLYDLRGQLALYPYQQTARILMLQNLYILHDPTFDEELRRAAIYITDRRIIFNLVEAAHYKSPCDKTPDKKTEETPEEKANRTVKLIDDFLDTMPEETSETRQHRKPTPADAAVDYVSYLLETEEAQSESRTEDTPQMKGQELIDNFIEKEDGRFHLHDEPEYTAEAYSPSADDDGKEGSNGYFTETLAKIYIKQERYSKALEIIKQLNLNYPKKNGYFADQIRFLEKLILNNKTK